MFEKYSTAALFLSKDAVLSCYACGKTSGLSIDAGASGTVISPVIDGWVDTKAVNRFAVGGTLLDSHVSGVLLRRQGIADIVPPFCIRKHVDGSSLVVRAVERLDLKSIHPSYAAWANLEVGRDFKESVCRMADSPLVETDPRFANLPLVPYELPDGTIVDVGVERFVLPELYMDPSSLDLDNPDLVNYVGSSSALPVQPLWSEGLPALVRDSVIRSESDSQAMLLANMVLSGGSSGLEGLSDRVKAEVERLVHQSAPGWRVRLTAPAAAERSLCPWLGGSILGSLGGWHELWVSRAEYEEFGPAIVHRKCP